MVDFQNRRVQVQEVHQVEAQEGRRRVVRRREGHQEVELEVQIVRLMRQVDSKRSSQEGWLSVSGPDCPLPPCLGES